MNRYWVSWYSGNYADEGCTKPPFKFWNTGYRDRKNKSGQEERTECSLCAVIDAVNEKEIWKIVKQYFPDYKFRFCEEKENNYTPNEDRFPR